MESHPSTPNLLAVLNLEPKNLEKQCVLHSLLNVLNFYSLVLSIFFSNSIFYKIAIYLYYDEYLFETNENLNIYLFIMNTSLKKF